MAAVLSADIVFRSDPALIVRELAVIMLKTDTKIGAVNSVCGVTFMLATDFLPTLKFPQVLSSLSSNSAKHYVVPYLTNIS